MVTERTFSVRCLTVNVNPSYPLVLKINYLQKIYSVYDSLKTKNSASVVNLIIFGLQIQKASQMDYIGEEVFFSAVFFFTKNAMRF